MVRQYGRKAKKNLREGAKKMEEVMTPAARVRRRLKAGRPRYLSNDAITPLQAFYKISTEADKARSLMRGAGLDPEDLRLALVYISPQDVTEGSVRYKWLPAPGAAQQYYAELEEMAGKEVLMFLGILWSQIDRELVAKGEPAGVCWITQLMGGPGAEKHLFAAREHHMRTMRGVQEN